MTSGYSSPPLSRFLRPLRNKVSALAGLGTTLPTSSTATYSSSKTFVRPNIPPLCILPSPESSIRLDATSYELSKKIYAVYNVMKDIVERTEGLRIRSGGKSPSRIPSLSNLCCIIIGQHADPELEDGVTLLEGEQSVDLIDSLYEEIPPLYQGPALISHAMNIILSECPSIPTLLKLLLDVTLDHKLYYHSEVLLRKLLLVALSPPTPTRPPPVCHPAHSNFLIECLVRWEQKDNPYSTFIRILNDVVADVGSYDAWICKATTKLLLHERRDPLRVALISCNLVKFMAKPELHLPSRQISLMTCASPAMALRRSLRLWLDCVLHHMLSSVQTVVNRCIYDFLLTCKEYWAYISTADRSTAFLAPSEEVSSAIVSLSTLLLSRGLETDDSLLMQILEEGSHHSTTILSPLVSQTLALSIHLPECSEHIETYALSLRAHGFLQLEASLWASALNEVESIDATLQRYDKTALHEYSCVLIDRVEEAEHRCHGSSLETACAMKKRRGWEWDEAFGSWTAVGSIESPKQKKRSRSKRVSSSYCTLLTGPYCEEILEITLPQKRPRLVPRVSSFTSLLSSALSNSIVLHKENRKPIDDGKGNETEDTYVEEVDMVVPSSDDLNLFACATSSPVRS